MVDDCCGEIQLDLRNYIKIETVFKLFRLEHAEEDKNSRVMLDSLQRWKKMQIASRITKRLINAHATI